MASNLSLLIYELSASSNPKLQGFQLRKVTLSSIPHHRFLTHQSIVTSEENPDVAFWWFKTLQIKISQWTGQSNKFNAVYQAHATENPRTEIEIQPSFAAHTVTLRHVQDIALKRERWREGKNLDVKWTFSKGAHPERKRVTAQLGWYIFSSSFWAKSAYSTGKDKLVKTEISKFASPFKGDSKSVSKNK